MGHYCKQKEGSPEKKDGCSFLDIRKVILGPGPLVKAGKNEELLWGQEAASSYQGRQISGKTPSAGSNIKTDLLPICGELSS